MPKKTFFTKLSKRAMTNSVKILSEIEDILGIQFKSSPHDFYNDIDFQFNELGEIVDLTLRNCQIKSLSRIIKTLEKIPTLRRLDLTSNHLESISSLKRISFIEELLVSYNNIHDIRVFKDLTNIRRLHISNNPINNIGYINIIDKLEDLNISDCLNLDVENLNNESIIKLNAGSLNLENLNFINNCALIEELIIDGNERIDYDSIGNIPTLKILEMENNKIIDLSILEKFPNLESVNLGRNFLTDINSFPKLKKLISINFDNNSIRNIDSLSDYPNLKRIRFIKNKLKNLSVLSNLKEIESVFMNENLIDSLEWFIDMPKLKQLFIAGNKIKKIGLLSKMSRLEELNLGRNGIEDITPVKYLKNINRLYLYQNKIKDISPVKDLKFLKNLWLSENLIEEIPSWLADFKSNIELGHFSQNSINVDGNPITLPPIEIVKQGNDAIKNYFEQLSKQKKEYLFEAKLLILGEPGAGKTSMSWKIENGECELPKEEDTTKGIDVRQYYFPLRAIDYPNFEQPQELIDRMFRVNLWDFGGQEIYKATHRFFLSKRSLYALVTDSRNENTDFNYWLHIVEMFGGNSPLLIVINEKHNRKRNVDVESMRKRFSNIVDVVEVDFSEKRKTRINRLLKEIRHYTTKLEHVGSPVPSTWVHIRKFVENTDANTINVQDYIDVCKANGIDKSSDALILSQYFHDIGVFLHFQDDDLLKHIIFLKSNWATNAVYKILDDSLLNKQKGKFSKQDATKIWSSEEYEFIRSELLQLMKKFFLLYEITNTGQYIVPERLPDLQPKYIWNNSNNLLLRYEYDFFMPKGILSQFIIQSHDFIDNHDLVWRRGVVLKRNEAIAEIIEAYDSRSLRIRISGKGKRDFLTIIVHEFDRINKIYEKMKVQKMIPCNCGLCYSDNKEPHFYLYDDLQRRIDKGREQVECPISYAMVNVKSLIDDVISVKKNELKVNETIMTAKEEGQYVSNKTKVFISYSHQDKKWLTKIQTKFKALNNLGVKLEVWDDTRISVGNEWRKEIKKAIETSSISVLLVSDDFLASDFIMKDELPPLLSAAKNMGSYIIPIVLRPCLYDMHEDLKEIQSLNPPSKALSKMRSSEQEEYFVTLIKFISNIVKE